MSRAPLRPPLAVALALTAWACGREEPPPPPPPVRVALFAHMDAARAVGPGEDGVAPGDAWTTRIGFDRPEDAPARLWLARPEGRALSWSAAPEAAGLRVTADGGVAGGALELSGLPDRARAALVLPAAGEARVRVAGRVRLAGNPLAGEASSREVLRVVELEQPHDDPGGLDGRARRRLETHRVSRTLDPSGWDRFELAFLTGSATRALELQLLHRSGDADAAVTLYDALEVDVEPLSAAGVRAELAARYRPRDGQEERTPWRLRVPLPAADGGRLEVRDAVLLTAPSALSIPLTVPAAEARPVLRFQYGMLPEAARADGDGALLEVRFEGDDGASTALAMLAIDPKNDRDQRRWQPARVALDAVAGRAGGLVFAVRDVPESAPDPLDAVVVATPRIEPAEQAPSAPNVLLVGVDTLRADRLSALGYERPTTPNLERLADAGVRFTSARSQAPWTLPSFSSILTSLYPSAHGAGRGGHDEWTPIDPTTVSIAEVLARVGYETQGVVANGLISPDYGLDQGFEGYGFAWAMESAAQDAEVVARFVDEHRTTPWLLFWHVMDPHLPYSTEDSFREAFTAAEYGGRFAGGRRPDVPFQVLDPRPGRRWYAWEGPPPPPELSPDDRRYVSDYYDAEIAEMDAAVGRVLDALVESGQWERTIVAFVADHGEGLGDHGHYHHGYTLFEDQVRVPLLLRIPGRDEGRVVERPVAAIDLAPTILAAIGLAPPAAFQGVDRLAADAPEDDGYVIEYPTYDSSAQKAFVLGRFKYLHDPVFRTEALYDLEADPGETDDVRAQHPERVARARAELDRFRWEQLQRGRYHLRVRGPRGARLALTLRTDDLFDANFACRPQVDEAQLTMDRDRGRLELATTLIEERLELVFWCRGEVVDVELSLDGQPLVLALGDGDPRPTPLELARSAIPAATGRELAWPGGGRATLWLESGAAAALPVVPDPDEIELLQELGYTR